MMKGISTFVAMTLIIAITITVTAVYSGWFTNFIKSMTSTIKEQSGSKLTCSNGGIALSSLKYNQTSGYISGYVKNTEIIELGDVDIEIFFTNATRFVLDLNLTLAPGEQNSFSSNINTNTYDIIRVRTNCSNVYDEVSSTYVSLVS